MAEWAAAQYKAGMRGGRDVAAGVCPLVLEVPVRLWPARVLLGLAAVVRQPGEGFRGRRGGDMPSWRSDKAMLPTLAPGAFIRSTAAAKPSRSESWLQLRDAGDRSCGQES